jgi:hypothetical protein
MRRQKMERGWSKRWIHRRRRNERLRTSICSFTFSYLVSFPPLRLCNDALCTITFSTFGVFV